MSSVLMNVDKIKEHIKNNDGFCTVCGAISHGGVEPDAVNYMCEECGENKVVGMVTAVTFDWVIASEKKHPMLEEVAK
jgi:predicted RNA-binding Zn-ribbon protein involved in translation (DUF1610 family)